MDAMWGVLSIAHICILQFSYITVCAAFWAGVLITCDEKNEFMYNKSINMAFCVKRLLDNKTSNSAL